MHDDAHNNELQQRLAKLRQTAIEACGLATAARSEIGGVAHWNRLTCTEAEAWTSHLGQTGMRVYIEPAAPDNRKLLRFIERCLADSGHPGIDIVLEW